MKTDWIFYAVLLAAVAAEIFLVWLLWMPLTYRVTRKWMRRAQRARFKHWIHYPAFKRQVTPYSIAMNAAKHPTFTLNDLNALNDLFKLLDDQPSVRGIVPEIGCRFERSTMTDLAAQTSAAQSHAYVLELCSIGAEWGVHILRRAEVVGCTADRLLIFKLSEARNEEIAQRFVAFLEQAKPVTPDFQLHPSMLQGFIDTQMKESEAEEFFKLLIRYNPTSDISLVIPKASDSYNNDTMTPLGGQPGQVCKVVEVLHPGLIRKQNKNWRVKALVTIKNTSHYDD